MGNRLSKIVTRTGDDGTTGLGDGSRIVKSHPRMQAIGDVDELNCVIGLALGVLTNSEAIGYDFLVAIQNRLFDLGGELSIPGYFILDEDDVLVIEDEAERLNANLPYLKNFILPGGSELVARIHHARAVARRAERSVVELSNIEPINEEGRKYLNRLSDYLFVLARVHANGNDVLWVPKEKRSENV